MKDKNKVILSYTDFNGNLKDRSVYPWQDWELHNEMLLERTALFWFLFFLSLPTITKNNFRYDTPAETHK